MVDTKNSDIVTPQGRGADPTPHWLPKSFLWVTQILRVAQGTLTNLFKLLDLGLIKHGEDIGAGSAFCPFPGSPRCLRGSG